MESVSGFLSGNGLVSQLAIVILTMIGLQVVMSLIEQVNSFYKKMYRQAVVLFNNTTTTSVTIPQGPDTGFPILYNSRDEQQGSAFSYSMFLFIHPDTFEASSSSDENCVNTTSKNAPGTLKHIFHKGNDSGFPNLAPAVFVEGDKNTLRIYMNTINIYNI
jgi:hypothetical protein